jgi:hypothetical protein
VRSERQIGDVVYPGGPDEIMFATSISPRVILGFATPVDLPVARMPSYLVRLTPATLLMETYALPVTFGNSPIAAFLSGSLLSVLNARGGRIDIEY